MNRVEWNHDISCDGHCFTLPETNMSLENWWLEDDRFILRNGTLCRGTFVSLPFHFETLHFDLAPEMEMEGLSHLGNKKAFHLPESKILYTFLISEIWIMSLSHMKSNIKLEYLPLKSSNHFNLHHFWGGENKSVNQWIFVLHPATDRLLVRTSLSPCRAKGQVHQVTSPWYLEPNQGVFFASRKNPTCKGVLVGVAESSGVRYLTRG